MNNNSEQGAARQTNVPILPRIDPQMQLFAEHGQGSDEAMASGTSEGGGKARERSPSEELFLFATDICSSSKKAKFESSATTSSSSIAKSPLLLPPPMPAPSPFRNQGANFNDDDCGYDKGGPEEPSYPSDDVRLVKVGDGQWMCDVCKETLFTSFGEACIHEVVCKMIARDTSASTLEALLHASSGVDKSKDESKDDSKDDASNEQTETVLKKAGPAEAAKEPTKTIQNEAAQVPRKKVQSEDATSKSAAEGPPSRTEARLLSVPLAPKEEERGILSDYNYILTQNIEFFESVTKMGHPGVGRDDSTVSFSRIGLRCIHCSGHRYHITAASFFPSSTASIASGLGTIGARHFLGGKCPSVSSDTLQQLRSTKKNSQIQTRSVGRVGLDAYCKDLAIKNGIATHRAGGIHFTGAEAEKTTEVEEATEEKTAPKQEPEVCLATAPEKNDESPKDEAPKDDAEKAPTSAVLWSADADIPQKEYTGKPDKIEASSFVPGRIENFWECKHCTALPVPWRAAGSVVFSSSAPSLEIVRDHLEKCQGLATLCVPRTAQIEIGYGERVPPIRISWDNSQLLKKSDSIERKKATGGSTRKNSLLPSGEVKTGVESIALVAPDDQELTTDFAYTTMTLLKKCYLTKSGGSRGNCPLGYPGLACSYCAGQPNERRFFYTSADHLRNSFSHIPSHLLVCSHCPSEVRQKLGALKALRNKQKAQLHAGSNKVFIDNVWNRLHGANDVRKGDRADADSESSDDESEVSIDELCYSSATVLTEMKASTETKASTRSSQPAAVSKIEFGSSALVVSEEKHLTTDLVYLSLLQCVVYNLTEADLALGLGEVGLPVLSCKHCKDEEGGRKLFVARSTSHLRSTLSSVSNHLAVCVKCPQEIKAQLDSVKKLRAEQEADLKRGMQLKFCEKVWSRLIMQDQSEKPVVPQLVLPNGASQLVLAEDRSLVSDFTHYTMAQMVPCILEASGAGARSTFEPGWPGLACSYCSGQPNHRKFYYRNSEILSGNYSHIPNHLMSCRQCPLEVKAALAEKKKTHSAQKTKLGRGSQRAFFNRIWCRLFDNRPLLMKGIQNAESTATADVKADASGTTVSNESPDAAMADAKATDSSTAFSKETDSSTVLSKETDSSTALSKETDSSTASKEA